MSGREATPDQIRWFRRLKRCITDMPDGVAVLVRHGSLELITPEDREETFNQCGCLDACPALDFFSVSSGKVEPAGEGV